MCALSITRRPSTATGRLFCIRTAQFEQPAELIFLKASGEPNLTRAYERNEKIKNKRINLFSLNKSPFFFFF